MKRIFFALLLMGLPAGCASPQNDVSLVMQGLNKAYADKDSQAFMDKISIDYQGKREDLKLAVENDFAGFVSVDFNTQVAESESDEETQHVKAKILFLRTAKSARFGVDNQSGETTLEFVKENGEFKLWHMPYPPLYGLIVP